VRDFEEVKRSGRAVLSEQQQYMMAQNPVPQGKWNQHVTESVWKTKLPFGLFNGRDRILCVAGIALVALALFCAGGVAGSEEYGIINTGIKAGGCWYDDTHFVVVKGQQLIPGQGFEVEGLYYLDPNKPKDLRRIDLSPLEPDLQKHIRDVTCQEQTILFHILTADRKRNQLYTLKLGNAPVLLAEKTEGFIVPSSVNVRNQYVIGFGSALGGEVGLHSSAMPERAKEECRLAYLQPGYRAVCLRHDRGTKRTWLLNDAYLAEYLWDETVRVSKDGAYQWVPNPEPPLRLADGTELKHGYLLRGFENRIVQEIPMRHRLYKIDTIRFKPNPGRNYLYASCSKAGDYNPPMTLFGRICRFKLAGTDNQWEEVFSIQKEPNERATLDDLDVNDQGDVVVMRRANRISPTLWKYTAQRAQAEQLPITQLSQEIGAVQLAPDGQTISYVDKDQLVFVRLSGGKP
jgi:hypothetical protein